jgi:hypothetical protein
MEGDDDVLEENHVLVTEGHSKSRNDGGENVKELGSTVEFVSLVDEGVEALVNSLTDHFPARH